MGYIQRFRCTWGFQVLILALHFSLGHSFLRGSRWRRKAWRSSSFRTFDFIPSWLSLALEASLSEAYSCGSSPASGSGGLKESKTCFYKKKQVKTFRSSTRRQNCEYTTLQFTHHTLGKDLLAEYGAAGHRGIMLFFINLVKERTCFWTVSSGTSSSKVLDLSFKPY
jgi:hypothetical protein